MVTLDRWRWVTIGSLVVAFAVSVVATPADTAIARGFFVVTVVGGIVAGAGLRGRRTQAVSAIAACVLVVGQRTPGQPVADPPAPDWRVQLDNADDRATVVIGLEDPQWRTAMAQADGIGAYVCAEAIGDRERALMLTISGANGSMQVTLGSRQASGARARPNQGGFYRADVPKAMLSGIPNVTVTVSRDDADGPPAIAPFLCGAHILRSSAYSSSSVLHRKGQMLVPGPKGPGRWVIELRAEGRDGRVLLAWY